jgi:predicted transposase YbfD/YdcC
LCCTYNLPRHFTGFAGVRQAYRLEREVTYNKSGRVVRESQEVVYGMTSLPRLVARAKRLQELVCGRWTTENRVHYVRDVTLGEDISQAHVGNIPQIMAAFCNTALAVLRKEGHVNVAAARPYMACKPKQALPLTGCSITE